MKSRVKSGIVVLNYNSYQLTCDLVRSACVMDGIDYIVLVDNNSRDNFDEFASSMPDKVIYVKNSENSGYAKGNNIGLRILKEKGCEVGFIANPDVIFTQDCIINIASFLNEHRDYGVASCSRSGSNGSATGQYWWIPDYKYTVLEATFLGRKYLNKKCISITNSEEKSLDSDFKTVEVVGGSFFGCNLEYLSEMDYLDENTFLWYEENILSFRLREKGLKVAYLNNCHYIHNHIKKGRGNKNIHILFKSKRHYCYKYLKINPLQKVLLGIADTIGLIEGKLIYLLFG